MERWWPGSRFCGYGKSLVGVAPDWWRPPCSRRGDFTATSRAGSCKIERRAGFHPVRPNSHLLQSLIARCRSRTRDHRPTLQSAKYLFKHTLGDLRTLEKRTLTHTRGQEGGNGSGT